MVIINDGSTDGTPSILLGEAQIDNRITVLHQRNSGPAKARNKGISAVSDDDEFVLFIDADDSLEQDALRHLVNIAVNNADCIGSCGLTLLVDQNNSPIGLHRSARQMMPAGGAKLVFPNARITQRMLLAYNIICTGSVLLRADVVKKLARFRGPDGVEDWDWWYRSLSYGDLAFTDRIVLRYRQTPGSHSRARCRAQIAAAVMRRRWLEEAGDKDRLVLVAAAREVFRRSASTQAAVVRNELLSGKRIRVTQLLRLMAMLLRVFIPIELVLSSLSWIARFGARYKTE